MTTSNFSDQNDSLNAIVAKLLAQGLYVPPPERDSRSTIGSVPAFIELARGMDPLDRPPGDAHRAHARRDGRKRDPAKDGVKIGFTFARTLSLQLAPSGVWWFPQPCLVVRDWYTESEGRGPLVVTDL